MEVSAKYEGQQLEFQLSGELDHHGAKGLLDCLEREIERTVPMSLVLDFPASHLWTAPVSLWRCGGGSVCGRSAAVCCCVMWQSSPGRYLRHPASAA